VYYLDNKVFVTIDARCNHEKRWLVFVPFKA